MTFEEHREAVLTKPVWEFLVRDGDQIVRAFAIYADGRHEGFPKEGILINRVPGYGQFCVAERLHYQEQRNEKAQG